MKGHILAALRELFERWEELLHGLREEQIMAPQFDHGWSIKDVVAHLWAWQQISIARMEAAARDEEPALPEWVAGLPAGWEENANQTNAQIYRSQRDKTWPEVYQKWREGFLYFLECGERISERDLLDGGRYPWLHGYPLAFVLTASYDHHQEHVEKLEARLREGGR